MSINWNNLRTWDGSQQFAFEELCCQLASYEPPHQAGARFIRKGAPDAGVECYWISSTGEEYAWQAKFFTQSPEEAQWRQLDESVRTALDKHHNLKTYTVCLPIDRADPRILDAAGRQQKWFMDKWEERVAKWRVWASAKHTAVNFNYWGEHELFERLSREEHRGRHYFWFKAELFSDLWFGRRLEQAIADAGERYTPKLNVELPIAQIFDGLGRAPEFFQRVKVLHGSVRHSYADAVSTEIAEKAPIEYRAFCEPIDKLLVLLQDIQDGSLFPIPFERIAELSSDAQEHAFEYKAATLRIDEEHKKLFAAESESENTV